MVKKSYDPNKNANGRDEELQLMKNSSLSKTPTIVRDEHADIHELAPLKEEKGKRSVN